MHTQTPLGGGVIVGLVRNVARTYFMEQVCIHAYIYRSASFGLASVIFYLHHHYHNHHQLLVHMTVVYLACLWSRMPNCCVTVWLLKLYQHWFPSFPVTVASVIRIYHRSMICTPNTCRQFKQFSQYLLYVYLQCP